MARPKTEHPTPGELEVLKVLWDQGPCTVREVMDALNGARRRRAYTSVMSLLNVMADKGLLAREPEGRAFRYRVCVERERTLGEMVQDLMGRAFEGSASALVSHMLEASSPSHEELHQIRQAIDHYVDEEAGER